MLPAHVHVVVVGQTRQQSRYQSLMASLGLTDRVHFLGPRNDVEVLMNAADLLVHPTLEDSFGMVALEAMAMGLPVVVSAAPYCGLSAELTHLKDAWLLTDPRNSHALADAIQQLLAQPDLRQVLRDGGLAQADVRTWTMAAQK